ncbi:MAG: hypothetical protein HWQ23_03160 [Nostoc sp. JL33]|nr:hypothetical protein [Nostoc sp. JL33]
MNLNNQQKLLHTPLFTSPSVLFPDFFCSGVARRRYRFHWVSNAIAPITRPVVWLVGT